MVSSFGNVYSSVQSGKMLKLSCNNNRGYECVILYKNGEVMKIMCVHRLLQLISSFSSDLRSITLYLARNIMYRGTYERSCMEAGRLVGSSF
jgi:hypothetical protein